LGREWWTRAVGGVVESSGRLWLNEARHFFCGCSSRRGVPWPGTYPLEPLSAAAGGCGAAGQWRAAAAAWRLCCRELSGWRLEPGNLGPWKLPLGRTCAVSGRKGRQQPAAQPREAADKLLPPACLLMRTACARDGKRVAARACWPLRASDLYMSCTSKEASLP